MRFYESRGALMVEGENERDVLITGHFMQRENQVKVSDYLRSVAEKLNEMEPLSDAMSDYLEKVDTKVQAQATAEKFLEEVAF